MEGAEHHHGRNRRKMLLAEGTAHSKAGTCEPAPDRGAEANLPSRQLC